MRLRSDLLPWKGLPDLNAGTKLFWLPRATAGATSRGLPDDEAPLRAELFSADPDGATRQGPRGNAHADCGPAADQLLERLAANESALVAVCQLLTAAVTENRRITPAGEWLLDNFYLIEEQIRTARRHLPKGYSRELPRLAHGPSADCPRVYDLALEAIAHGDGRVDTETLSRFVAAYQTVTPLKLGELWADSDHAAAGPDRESAPRRRAHRRRLGRAKPGRFLGRPDDGDRRAAIPRA
jgi:cyclic beta-1,2-glucan synthetase